MGKEYGMKPAGQVTPQARAEAGYKMEGDPNGNREERRRYARWLKTHASQVAASPPVVEPPGCGQTDRQALDALLARFGLEPCEDWWALEPGDVALDDDGGPPGYHATFRFDADGKFVGYGIRC